ncbi:hypothetical protein Y032_0023g810 [Ancylostoma ceylanicum]|uniref:Uncharacterized protein n=1 Tax=Ancylostoma ceylanicum TaxID=53326 RepID=A0A016UZT7_9BILA|nr:hypothetical protein Y032_0023g810 [Ancylostoma ceylanicum]
MNTRVTQYAEYEYDNRAAPNYRFINFIDFFHFRSETGKDVSPRVLQCAEHEYDNHFQRGYRFIDFIDFFTYARGRVRTCQVWFSTCLTRI